MNKVEQNRQYNKPHMLTTWVSERIVDSGPILRLQQGDKTLSKMERYGHPCERDVISSCLQIQELEALLVSYLKRAYSRTSERDSWTWQELHCVNQAQDWEEWTASAATACCSSVL